MIRFRTTLRFVATAFACGIATFAACIDLPVAPLNEDVASLRCAPDDDFEDNDTPESALAVPFGLLRGLSCRRAGAGVQDYDFFVVEGTPDSTYRAWLVAPDADSVAELRLFDEANGGAVVPEIDGNLRMPSSGRLLASVRLCCGTPGDSLPYELLLSDIPNRGPNAAFDWAPVNPIVGATVTFNSLASDPDGDSLTVRAWRLSDGRTAEGMSVDFVWDTAGTYTVTHYATDQWGRADSTALPIEIGAPIERIEITPPSPLLTALGDSVQLIAVARDSVNAIVPGVPFVWSIEDTTVVSVEADGIVVARTVGSAFVRVAAFGVTDSVLVSVQQNVSSVEVLPSGVIINSLDSTVALSAMAFDARGYEIPDARINWTSDSVAIVMVSSTGVLTPVADGLTTVRAESDGVEDTVVVTVSLPVTGGPIASVIASPDTAMLLAPYKDSTRVYVRAVDANGITLTGQTFTWQFLDSGGDFFIQALGVGGDSMRIVPPYYGTSSRRKMRVEVSSGGFADTLVFFVVAPRSWIDVSAGGAHTCGISYSDWDFGGRELYCWGSNLDGQLGLPLSVADAPVPTRVPFDTLNFQRVVTGSGFTCGLSQGARAFCWGTNLQGELGGVSAESCDGTPCSHEPIEVGSGIAQISAGSYHVCTRNVQFGFLGYSAPPEVKCWGSNQSGQLALDSTTTPSLGTPTVVTGIPTTGGGQDIEAFGQTTCAVMTDRRYCWGRNRSGEFGLGDTVSTHVPQSSPISALYDTWVVGGEDFACGIPTQGTQDYGSISCWGGDTFGQLGLPGAFVRQSCGVGLQYPCVTDATDYPFPRPLFGGSNLTPSKAQIGIGARHVCTIQGNIQLLCWGNNGDGQLGDGTRIGRRVPVSIAFTTNYHEFVTSGEAHSCVSIYQEGLYCWGNGAGGRLGDGARSDRLTPVRIVDP